MNVVGVTAAVAVVCLALMEAIPCVKNFHHVSFDFGLTILVSRHASFDLDVNLSVCQLNVYVLMVLKIHFSVSADATVI